MFLPVENFQEFTAYLDAGEEIGMLQPWETPLPNCENTTHPVPNTSATVNTNSSIARMTGKTPNGTPATTRQAVTTGK